MTAPALLFALLSAAPQATGTPVRLTLDEAVNRALSVSAQLQELVQRQVAARADLDGAHAGRWPEAGVAAGYTRRSNIDPFLIPQPPGEPPVGFPNLPNNTSLEARASVPLYAGGRISGQIDAATESERAAGLDIDTGRQALILQTKNAYWGLVTARESERVLREALDAFDAHVRDAVNRERFGLAARSDVLAVEVERERAELRRLRAENNAALARARFVRLLDLPPDAVIEPTEKLEGPPPAQEDLEALVQHALEGRPDHGSLLAQIKAAEAQVQVAQAVTRPQLGVAGGVLYANPNRAFVPPDDSWRWSWDVGVQVSLKVFDGGRTSASVARAQARAESLRRQLEDLERSIRLEVTSAHLGVDAARLAIRVADGAVASGRESQRVSSNRYREGVIPSSELLDAEIALLESGLERTRALADARLAAAELDRAVGR